MDYLTRFALYFVLYFVPIFGAWAVLTTVREIFTRFRSGGGVPR